MKRPQAILHIGPHKTGSTSFQVCLNVNRENLLHQGFGVYTPLNNGINSAEIAGAVKSSEKTRQEKIRKHIHSQMLQPKRRKIIFSAEPLALLRSHDDLLTLRGLFPEDTFFRVLVVKRKEDEWRLSANTLSLNKGKNTEIQRDDFINMVTNWNAIFSAWSEFADEIVVVEYKKDGLIENMLHDLGIDHDALKINQRHNASGLKLAFPYTAQFYSKYLAKRWPGRIKRKLFNGGGI